jgi:hypothetical protein
MDVCTVPLKKMMFMFEPYYCFKENQKVSGTFFRIWQLLDYIPLYISSVLRSLIFLVPCSFHFLPLWCSIEASHNILSFMADYFSASSVNGLRSWWFIIWFIIYCSSMFLLLLYSKNSCNSTNSPTYVYASSCFSPPILQPVGMFLNWIFFLFYLAPCSTIKRGFQLSSLITPLIGSSIICTLHL